jgi:glycosyltransferase involved in cell wall biosynthesis
MRALFYLTDTAWSGAARAFFVAARGLATRGHVSTIACVEGTLLQRRAGEEGLETLTVSDPTAAVGTMTDLRHALRERFVEVVFVTNERDQFLVSSALRLAERGAVIRRVPFLEGLDTPPGGRLARLIASAGLLVSSEREAQRAQASAWAIPPTIAPLGVDVSAYDGPSPTPRHELGVPGDALVLACVYEPTARQRVATLFRTLSLLAPRHPELRAILVGPGSRDEDLRMHATALGVSSVVTFLGERVDEMNALRAANVGWVVAGGDTGAFACLDVMALRLPLIAERWPVAQHFISDGITGVLLAPGDAAHTASQVAAFLAHEDQRIAMGNAGRARVQREFPESAMIDGFERALEVASDRAKWAVK